MLTYPKKKKKNFKCTPRRSTITMIVDHKLLGNKDIIGNTPTLHKS